MYQQCNGAVGVPTLINVCDNNFHWIEFKGQNVGGAGQLAQLYVDGLLEIQCVQGGNATAVNAFTFFPLAGGVTTTIDDFIIISTATGGYPQMTANFPLGQQTITTTRPTADSSVAFATSSASASHAVLVNGVGKSTATWVQSATPAADDLYTYGGLGFTPASINGVTLNSYVANTSIGGALYNDVNFESSVAVGFIYGGGSSAVVPGIPTLQQAYMQDSLTSTRWASSTFSAATWGVRVSTASS